MSVAILFENEYFLAVDKPSGVLSVPGRAGEKDERPTLTRILSSKKIFPVHRLDFEVSGAVLFAKTADAHREANGWFQDRKIRKTYEAWTECGSALPGGETMEWTCKMLKGKRRAYLSEHGDLAVTQAKAVEMREGIATWELRPLTGRSHQLRFELSRHGFPIIGDALYGALKPFRPNAIALRSRSLDFSGCDQAESRGLPSKIEAVSLAEFFSDIDAAAGPDRQALTASFIKEVERG